MIVHRTAFKIAGEWHVLGLAYRTLEEAEQRVAHCRTQNREVIAVTIDEANPNFGEAK